MTTRPSGRSVRRWLAIPVALTCALGVSGGLQAAAQAAAGSTTNGPESRPFEPGDDAMTGAAVHTRSNSASHVPSSHVPRPAALAVASNAGAKRVEGLNMKDQRDSNGGNSFSLEPPDQALCVSGTQVIEGVNDVFTIYAKGSPAPVAPGAATSYDVFFSGQSEVNRDPNADPATIFGPFVSDPKCYFDPADGGHFYMTILELGVDRATGDFDGTSFEDIAVSKTATPTTDPSTWYRYQLDVANNGNPDTTGRTDLAAPPAPGPALQKHAGCPCLGDQPLIGADANGFYITTNEFSIDGPEFNGAQVYAFDKNALAHGTLKVQRIENNGPAGLGLAEGTAYSIQPATSPVAAEWSNASNGTEYALSALDFSAKLDNRVARWAFTNTASLLTDHPAVHLSSTVIDSEVYGQPPAVVQKSGPYPLGQSLKERLNLLNSNDDRMNQVVYSGGNLWGGVNTVAKAGNGPTTTAIAYFVVDAVAPAATAMANQGYVAVNRNSVMYPAIGVAPGGSRAAMVFTLAGPGFYPSTAYVTLSSAGDVTSPVTVYAAGPKPADGFTGYPKEGGDGVERWGDYSAAVADSAGVVWMATEYIPGTFDYNPATGKYIANWGTAVGSI